MPNKLKSSIVLSFIRETPAESIRLLEKTLTKTTENYEYGEIVLDKNRTEAVLASDVTDFYMVSDRPVTVQIDDGLAELDDMQIFSHSGGSHTFKVINKDNMQTPKIVYASGITN